MKRSFLFFWVLLGCLSLAAQERFPVSGIVRVESGEPLPGAVVLLLDKVDPSRTFGTACDENGTFSVSVPAGAYVFELSFLGYEKHRTDVQVSGVVRLDTVRLRPLATEIAGVTVRGSEIARHSNGYVMTVGKQYAGIGLNDILRTAPGIWVEREAIKVYGKTVSKVYIDDREVRLGGKALQDYLSTFLGDNVRKIDVVVSSGAEEDAASMGGRILRITTARLRENGGMAVLMTNVEYSRRVLPSFMPRVNLNLRQGKFTAYTRANYANAEFKQDMTLEHRVYETGVSGTSESRVHITDPYAYGVVAGIGYDADSCNLLSVEGSYSRQMDKSDVRARSVSRTDDRITEQVEETMRDRSRGMNANVSFNYVHLMRKEGKLVLKADWLESERRQTGDNRYLYLLAEEEERSVNRIDFRRRMYTASLDFSRPFRGGKDMLSAGMKYANVSSGNTTVYKNQLNGGEWVDDERYTDRYDYGEAICAAYLKYQWKWGRFALGAGLRAEHTQTDPRSQVNPDRNHKSSYTDFFPEAAVSYAAGEDEEHIFSLRYNRTLVRPSFRELNPYIYPTNSYSYGIGNPYLEPEYLHNAEFTATLFDDYVFALSYRRGSDAMQKIVYNDSGLFYEQTQNVGVTQNVSAYVEVPVRILQWWKVTGEVSYTFQDIRYGTEYRRNNGVSYGLSSVMTLPAGFRVLLDVYQTSSALWGNYRVRKPLPVIDAGVYKTLCHDRLSLHFRVEEILNSEGRMKLDVVSSEFSKRSRKRLDVRTFRVGASYRFNWGKTVRVREVEAGNLEERERD